MTGVFAVSIVAKSKSRDVGVGSGVGVLSMVGEPLSDMIEETERRLVRAGVRRGWLGGALELKGGGDISPSSMTVGWIASLNGRDSRSEPDILRIVELLICLWIDEVLLSVLSKGSTTDSSGVVGVEDTRSGCLISGETDSCVEASDVPSEFRRDS